MANLAELARDVLTKAGQVHAAEQAQQEQEQLNHRRLALEDLLKRAAKQREFAAAWESHGLPAWADEAVRDARQRARLRVQRARTSHQEDPTYLVEDERFRNLRFPLVKWVDDTDRALALAWKRYTAEALPPPLGGDEQLLRADPRTERGLVDRLLQWDRQLRALAAKTEPSADDLHQFVAMLTSRGEVWATVQIEADPEVIAFIRASGDRGAPLSLLTATVKDWLDQRNLTDQYVVRKAGD